jgi:hypothetical protein
VRVRVRARVRVRVGVRVRVRVCDLAGRAAVHQSGEQGLRPPAEVGHHDLVPRVRVRGTVTVRVTITSHLRNRARFAVKAAAA